jgi:PleD family two-component response regulator
MSQHHQVHTNISKFIDEIPTFTEQLDAALINLSKQRDSFTQSLESVLTLLKNIYAQGLESEATRILFIVDDDPKSKTLSSLVKTFISNLLTLSIDLQKAQYQDDNKEQTTIDETQNQVAKADFLSSIISFIDENKIDKVNSLLGILAEHYPNDFTIIRVTELMATKDYQGAKNVITNFISKKNETINQSIKTNLAKIILAVDDRPEILSFVNNALKSHFKLFCVPSGETAIKLLTMHKPDLFILDIDMPDMNGYELAEIIRSKAEFKQTPIIFLTGNSTREHISKAIKVGGNDFIVKPTSHETLLLKVGRFL